jgi:hypothetical protein
MQNYTDVFSLVLIVCSALSFFCYEAYMRWKASFIKVSMYQFTDVLCPTEWKNISQVKSEMEIHARGRLKLEDVERSLDNLEAEGLAVSRSFRVKAFFLYAKLEWMYLPQKQFKLCNYGDNLLLDNSPTLGTGTINA